MLREGALPPQIDEASIGSFEEEALRAANSVFSTLEGALAAWDASKEKPPELRKTAARYRMFAESIANWERKMLIIKGKKRDFKERVRMLQEFADICMSYGGD